MSGVTPEIMDALFKQESNHNPNAVGPTTKYGTAKGLGQLLDTTGRAMHKELGLKEKYDPFNAEQNAQISEYYLRKLYDRFGDIKLALAAYNWGPGNLSKAIKKFGRNYEVLEAKLPGQTKHYVRNITKTVGV
jgi:soluble lytic murein transglycosylase-like protein